LKSIFWLSMTLPLIGATQWPTAAPAEEGFRTDRLEALKTTLPSHKTVALLVARHGRIVLEWYEPGVTADKRQGTASLAKALVGGMSLLVALDAGRMGVDDPAYKYVQAWKDDPQKRLITIRQLATHSSGLEDAEQAGFTHMEIPGWKGAFWRRKPDPISIAIHDAPVVFPPGSKFGYSNPGMAALGYAVTASLRGTSTPDLFRALQQRVCRPLEIPDADWQISYGEKYAVDGMTVYGTWGGGAFTPRATARIGQLMLQGGRWKAEPLFGEAWVRRMVRYAQTPIPDRQDELEHLASGLAWWTNFDAVWKKIPRDAFAGAGAGQEVLLVVPSLDLVVVRNGAAMSPREQRRFWVDMEEYLFNPIVDALR